MALVGKPCPPIGARHVRIAPRAPQALHSSPTQTYPDASVALQGGSRSSRAAPRPSPRPAAQSCSSCGRPGACGGAARWAVSRCSSSRVKGGARCAPRRNAAAAKCPPPPLRPPSPVAQVRPLPHGLPPPLPAAAQAPRAGADGGGGVPGGGRPPDARLRGAAGLCSVCTPPHTFLCAACLAQPCADRALTDSRHTHKHSPGRQHGVCSRGGQRRPGGRAHAAGGGQRHPSRLCHWCAQAGGGSGGERTRRVARCWRGGGQL